MQMQRLEFILWAAGFCLSTCLFFILCWRSRQSERWFKAWIGFGCLNSIVLFTTSRLSVPHLYFWCYWGAAFIDIVMQLCVIYEMARSVLKVRGTWVSQSNIRLRRLFYYALPVAFTISSVFKPAADSQVDSIFARANLFMTLLFCFIMGSVVRVSGELGLRWRGRSAKLAYGLVFWNLLSFVTDTLHTYWSTVAYFNNLEYVRDVSFLVVVMYWILLSWRGTLNQHDAEEHSSSQGRNLIEQNAVNHARSRETLAL